MSTPIDDGKTAQAQPQGEYMAMMREANSPETKNRNLRDWFAGMAMPAVYREAVGELSESQIASDAYRMADAMLEARKGEA